MVFCDEAAGEDGEVELAEGDLAAERVGELGFDPGAEVVSVEEERDCEGDEEDEGDDAAEDDEESSVTGCHGSLLRSNL